MALSDRTRAEMEAGARSVAAHAQVPADNLDLDALFRVQERAAYLNRMEAQGRITIVRQLRFHTNIKDGNPRIMMEVRVGEVTFKDDDAVVNGCWPSELLVAQVALAIEAGQSNDEEHGGG